MPWAAASKAGSAMAAMYGIHPPVIIAMSGLLLLRPRLARCGLSARLHTHHICYWHNLHPVPDEQVPSPDP